MIYLLVLKQGRDTTKIMILERSVLLRLPTWFLLQDHYLRCKCTPLYTRLPTWLLLQDHYLRCKCMPLSTALNYYVPIICTQKNNPWDHGSEETKKSLLFHLKAICLEKWNFPFASHIICTSRCSVNASCSYSSSCTHHIDHLLTLLIVHISTTELVKKKTIFSSIVKPPSMPHQGHTAMVGLP
jgi:hypothetical protein